MTIINKVIIYNPVNYHYECIESVIHFLPQILRGRVFDPQLEIILNICTQDAGFIKYITTYTSRMISRYSLGSIKIIDVNGNTVSGNTGNEQKQILIPSSESEARIVLTIPSESEMKPISTYYEPYTYVISHYYFKSRPTIANIFYLAPHCGNPQQFFIPIVLPFSPESVSHIPRPQLDGSRPLNLLVQGEITRRSIQELRILIDLVKISNKKLTNAAHPPVNLYILTRYNPIKSVKHPNIIFKINKDFWEFNQIASQCDIILPLVSKRGNLEYFKTKLTSSISYGLGYHMQFIIDADLAKIYNLDITSCHTYSSSTEFRSKLITVFKKHLESHTTM